MSFQIKGLNELQNKLHNLANRAKAIDGSHNVPLSELLPARFLKTHTQFDSVEDMMSKSGFKIESSEDFKAIPDDQWDAFIRGHTKFSTWKEMLQLAAADWTKNQLGL